MAYRKGLTRKTLVVLILIILVSGILSIAYATIIRAATDSADIELCRKSVLARDRYFIDIGIFGDDILPPLFCKTGEAKDVEVSTRDDALNTISELAAECWYKFADGQVLDVFGQQRLESGKACGVCSRFRFIGDEFEGNISDYPIDYRPDMGNSNEKTISAEEVVNYWVNTVYNPPVLRGGASYEYISASFEFQTRLSPPSDHEILMHRSIRSRLIDESDFIYVSDYSGRLSHDVLNEIQSLGQDFREDNIGDLFVVVAEEFNSLALSRTRQIADNIALDNASTRQGVMLMLGIQNEEVRLLIGSDHESRILREQIRPLLSKHFYQGVGSEVSSVQELGQAIINTLIELHDTLKITDLSSDVIPGDSYMFEISDGMRFPPIVKDINISVPYYVAFVSTSDVPAWYKRIFDSDHRLFSPDIIGNNALIIAPASEIFDECDLIE